LFIFDAVVPVKPRILVVDGEPDSRDRLVVALQDVGYLVLQATAGEDGLSMLRDAPPDALILDLDLPDMDGRQVLEQARRFFQRPILIVSRRSGLDDKVQALDLGADDYVQKPFDAEELLARLRAATRNKLTREGAPLTLKAGEVEIDLRYRIVRRSGAEVRLSTREYNLLVELAKGAGKVLTHRQLLTAVWGPDRVDHVEYLRVFIQQLRQKLEHDPSAPRLLLTETGVGYRFGG